MTFKINGKNVGTLTDGVFSKTVSRSKHFLWARHTYGIASLVVNALRDKCHTVKITEKETGDVWTTSYETLDANGVRDQYGQYEPQVFLPMDYWNIKKHPRKVETAEEKEIRLLQSALL